jgi:heme exporter protein C
MLALTVLAFTWVPPAQNFRDPGSARIILFHVPAAFTCTLCFLAGGFFGWRYLRRRDPMDDSRAAAANEVGLTFGIITLLTGMVFAAMQWGKPWHWDPRQTSFLLQLMIYAAYFALRSSVEDDRRRAAVSSGYTVFAAPANVPRGLAAPQQCDGEQAGAGLVLPHGRLLGLCDLLAAGIRAVPHAHGNLRVGGKTI